jgi:hypothetical protein
MDRPILVSTFFLTLLLGIGLWFFIRASVKDRTESLRFWADSDVAMLDQLQHYFSDRAYRITQVDPTQQQVIYSGFVKPSLGLAIFLSILAGIGLLCLGLVLAIVLPALTLFFLGLVILAPLAGWFYWRQAGRIEEVTLRVEPSSKTEQQSFSIKAHRDELIEIQRVFTLNLLDEI